MRHYYIRGMHPHPDVLPRLRGGGSFLRMENFYSFLRIKSANRKKSPPPNRNRLFPNKPELPIANC